MVCNKMYTEEFDKKVLKYKRTLVKELLDQCTDEQKDFFNRIHGCIGKIIDDKCRHAYRQCKRTIEINQNNGQSNSK
jgi:hypothetical protein